VSSPPAAAQEAPGAPGAAGVGAQSVGPAAPERPAAAPRPRRGSRAWWAGVTPVPTVRAAALLAAGGLVVLLVPAMPGGPVLAGAVVAVLLVADAVLAPAPWRVGVARDLPPVLPLGGQGTVEWRVANPGRRALQVALADELAPSLGASTRRVRLRVTPRGVGRATATLQPTRRGTFRPTELTVRVTGPLGLVVRQAPRALPGRLQVHPSFHSRRAAELRLRRARLLEQGLRSVRGRGGGTEFEALRDYIEGDEVRHVDWPATARMGRPIVRTHRAERNQTVSCCSTPDG
jgi:uncharacterized protein (DUF58 family)